MSTIGNQPLGGQSMSSGNQSRDNATEDLRRKAGDVKQSVQELGSVAKAAASEKMGELRDTAADYYERGRERVSDAEQSVEDYIREQPLKSVLLAAGIGFLFGAFYIRR